MLPTLFDVGGTPVHAYFVFNLLAYALGFWWLHRGARRVLVDPDGLPGLYISLFVSGWVGARLMHLIGGEGVIQPGAILDALVSSMVGVAFLGGVLGGAAGAVVYMLWTRLPVFKILDVAAPGLMLGLASGRMGCLLAGCCHGRRVAVDRWDPLISLAGGDLVTIDSLPFVAVIFRQGAHGSIFDVPVHPTQIIESVAVLTLAMGLAWMGRRVRRFDGQIFATMLLGYGIVRWINEGFRGDLVRGAAHDLAGWSLSTGRISSLVIVVVAMALTVLRFRSGVAPEPVAGRHVAEEPVILDTSGLSD